MSSWAGKAGEVWPIMPVRNQQVRAVVRATRMRPGVGVELPLFWRGGVGAAELGFWSMGAVGGGSMFLMRGMVLWLTALW